MLLLTKSRCACSDMVRVVVRTARCTLSELPTAHICQWSCSVISVIPEEEKYLHNHCYIGQCNSHYITQMVSTLNGLLQVVWPLSSKAVVLVHCNSLPGHQNAVTRCHLHVNRYGNLHIIAVLTGQ